MTIDALKIKRTIAADYRSGEIDLADDQVWELDEAGDPPALAMRTTYGLRTGSMRIFPQFKFDGATVSDPRSFTSPVKLLKRHRNYLQLECSPFPQLNIQLEFWVPSSKLLCGRFKLTNLSEAAINCAVDWTVVLKPLDKGEPMSPMQMGINTVLRGSSGNLHPVFFLTGGPEALPRALPALEVKSTLAGKTSRKMNWALATLDSVEASFALARQATSLFWDMETTRLEIADKSLLVEFDREGDEADLLLESQIKAHQLIISTPPPSSRLTFQTRRQADSRNFDLQSKKQELISFTQINAYDVWMLSRILLPGDPTPMKEIIEYFIDLQQPDGTIPWAISVNGTASTAKTPPLLAGIACELFPFVNDKGWLEKVYFPLLRSFKGWFAENKGCEPTWDTAVQTGIANNAFLTNLNGNSCLSEPRFILSPALNTLLLRECQALIKITDWLEVKEDARWLIETADSLTKTINDCWDGDQDTFTYRDIQTGQACSHELIHEFTHDGVYKLVRNFKTSKRLAIRLNGRDGAATRVKVKLTGKNGETPIIEEHNLRTGFTEQQVMLSQLFSRLESVEIEATKTKFTLELALAGNDSEDISLLLPLWSGTISKEKQSALVKNTLLPRYLCKNGLTTFPGDRVPQSQNSISPFWNNLIIEGLIACGRRDIAGKILSSLFSAQMKQWQTNGYVSSELNAANLQNTGELDSLAGLPTIWPLLKTLGIESLTGHEVILKGLNEFLPPITVKYKGTCIEMHSDRTIIENLKHEQVKIIEKGSFKVFLP